MTNQITATFTFQPVTISRGRGFKGFGYALPVNPEYYKSPVWDPAGREIVYINPEYFASAQVDESQISRQRDEFIEAQITGTVSWCKSQKPNASEIEIRNFARACLRKRAAYLLQFFDLENPVENNGLEATIRETCAWANSLKTKSCWMYGRYCEGGKPLAKARKIEIARKACLNKGLSGNPRFEEIFAKVSEEVIR